MNLARNSTFRRKKERLDSALEAYNSLMRSYPETEFSKETQKLYEQLQEELKAYQELENLAR